MENPGTELDKPLAEIGGRRYSDVNLWVRRDVEEDSRGGIEIAQHSFWPDEAIRRDGAFTMSILYPSEIRQAAKLAVAESVSNIGRSQTVEKLNEIMPATLAEPREAEVSGLGYFYNKIGIKVDYPGFEEERAILLRGMGELLGVDYDWMNVRPHVSIARRLLKEGRKEYRPLSNTEEIEQMLPDTIHLSPAQPLEV